MNVCFLPVIVSILYNNTVFKDVKIKMLSKQMKAYVLNGHLYYLSLKMITICFSL